MLFGKYIDKNNVELAPVNYEGILNFNKSEELMRAHGFKPIKETMIPFYDESYQKLKVEWIDGEPIIKKWFVEEFRSKEDAEKERMDSLSLTKREVFLALYKATGLMPEAVRAKIISPEALIEFDYAERYFRSNPLINSLGSLLGYSSSDLDILFETKEFPNK